MQTEKWILILRIPLTATRVSANDPRVRYAYRRGAVIPEELVLRRWKDRSSTDAARRQGEMFDGCRLHPHIWSTLSACADAGLPLDETLTAEGLREAMEGVRARGRHTGPIRADKYVTLVRFLRQSSVLDDVMRRERDPASPGVPDLFLWRHKGDGLPYGAGFVEVKRHAKDKSGTSCKERVSRTQREELAFLTALGLSARTVYVRETA
jgi:hypothetical protein